MRQFLMSLWVVSLAILIIQGAMAYPELQEKLAVHFDGNGRPDDWMNKDNFYTVWYALIIAANVCPMLVWLFLDKIWARIPHKLISIPNKEYWLKTPERQKEAARILLTVFSFLLLVINCFLILGFHAIQKFALTGHAVKLAWWWPATIIVASIFSVVYIYQAFRIKKEKKPKAPPG